MWMCVNLVLTGKYLTFVLMVRKLNHTNRLITCLFDFVVHMKLC